jgi:ankyrin repeat protein
LILLLLLLDYIDIGMSIIIGIASITTHPHHHHVSPCCVVSVVLLIIMLSSSQGNCTALIWASLNGHGDVVNTLIAHGADVNAKNMVWTIQ